MSTEHTSGLCSDVSKDLSAEHCEDITRRVDGSAGAIEVDCLNARASDKARRSNEICLAHSVESDDGKSAKTYIAESEVAAELETLCWIDSGISAAKLEIPSVMNKKDSGSASLGHARKVRKDAKTINLPGQLVAKDGSWGMKKTLTDVGYKDEFNFNLTSLARSSEAGTVEHIQDGILNIYRDEVHRRKLECLDAGKVKHKYDGSLNIRRDKAHQESKTAWKPERLEQNMGALTTSEEIRLIADSK